MIAFDLTLRETLAERNIPFDDDRIARAALYAAYLLDENQKMNLTAIVDEREIAVKHFADSLAPLNYVDLPKGASLADIGTGAGFPGMALRIFRPDLRITLIDALKKRCLFLERLCAELDIDDVDIRWGRAEELARDDALRERFDFAAARAVSSLPVLLEYAVPFLSVGGRFLALKGPAEEASPKTALTALACDIEAEHRYGLGGDERRLIVVKKKAPTAAKYPRRAGMPETGPL